MTLPEGTRERMAQALSWDDRRALSTEFEVEKATYQATGYAWGRGDCGDPTAGDTIRGLEFGRAYGQAKREYLTGGRYMLSNIRAAYEEWVSTGVIAWGETDRQANMEALVEVARQQMAHSV